MAAAMSPSHLRLGLSPRMPEFGHETRCVAVFEHSVLLHKVEAVPAAEVAGPVRHTAPNRCQGDEKAVGG